MRSSCTAAGRPLDRSAPRGQAASVHASTYLRPRASTPRRGIFSPPPLKPTSQRSTRSLAQRRPPFRAAFQRSHSRAPSLKMALAPWMEMRQPSRTKARSSAAARAAARRSQRFIMTDGAASLRICAMQCACFCTAPQSLVFKRCPVMRRRAVTQKGSLVKHSVPQKIACHP